MEIRRGKAVSLKTKNQETALKLYTRLMENYLPETERIIEQKINDMLSPPNCEGYIYFIQGGSDNLIKIGFAKDLNGRISRLQNGSPCKLNILATMEGTPMLEKELHKKFAPYRRHGEWFEPAEEILNYVKAL